MFGYKMAANENNDIAERGRFWVYSMESIGKLKIISKGMKTIQSSVILSN